MPNSLQSDYWQTVTPAIVIGKRRGYILLPAFDNDNDRWADIPTAILQFNYAASRNLTIPVLPSQPEDVNWIAVIKFHIDETVYRYKLWANPLEETEPLCNIPLYTGQVIKKNFAIEIWPNSSVALENLSDINIPVSILSHRDIFSDEDTFEDAVGVEITDLVNTNIIPDSFDFSGAIARYNTQDPTFITRDINNLVSQWVSYNLGDMTQGTGAAQPLYIESDNDFNGKGVVKFSSGKTLVGIIPFVPLIKQMFFIIRQDAWTDTKPIARIGIVNYLYQRGLSPGIAKDDETTEINATLGIPLLIILEPGDGFDAVTLTVINLRTGDSESVSGDGDLIAGVITLGDAAVSIADFIVYDNDNYLTGADRLAAIASLTNLYRPLALPLTYSEEQIVPNNTP